MKKIICCTFFLALIASMFLWSKFVFLNKFNMLTPTSDIKYTYIQDGIKCGNYYISENVSFIKFGECVECEGRVDINEFVDKNKLVLVSNEIVGDSCVYLMYSKDLPITRVLNNKRYNLQMCVTRDSYKLGYPAIFDSF